MGPSGIAVPGGSFFLVKIVSKSRDVHMIDSAVSAAILGGIFCVLKKSVFGT